MTGREGIHAWQRKENSFSLTSDYTIFSKLRHLFSDQDSVLDIGCGSARLGTLLRKWCPKAKYTGMDISDAAKKAVESKKFNFYDSIDKVKGKYDKITLIDVIEHMPIEVIRNYREKFDKLLKKGGLLIIATPNMDSCVFTLHNFWNNPEHVRPWTKSSIRNFFYGNYSLKKIIYACNYFNPIKIISNFLVFLKIPYTTAIYILKKQSEEI